MSESFVVAVGDAFNGIQLFGPFQVYEDGMAFAEGLISDWHVVQVEQPGEVSLNHQKAPSFGLWNVDYDSSRQELIVGHAIWNGHAVIGLQGQEADVNVFDIGGEPTHTLQALKVGPQEASVEDIATTAIRIAPQPRVLHCALWCFGIAEYSSAKAAIANGEQYARIEIDEAGNITGKVEL